ncbi:PDDEXK family nuclease [Sinomicrobium oceani]|uniref:hypothetical protein n=1 Tax=Sinomicrobium oceani TaxID=1150368 RepID=UPI00227B4BBC|nr:hypothetical protein [Sinomicrobium oceani]
MEIFRQVTANNITLKDYPFWKELAMEAYLLENEDILILDKENFNDVMVLDAEIALKAGRKTGDGRIDILAKYGGEYLGIVELKLNEINEHSLQQLQDYLDKKDQILQLGEYWNEDVAPKWVGLLVRNSISPDLQEKLRNGYDYNGLPIAGMIIRRFRSNENEIFVVSDTFFSYKYSSKDYSKFIFNGTEYNKGRLVNEVVRYYVELHPEITLSELKQIFPNILQGSFGVFDKKSRAEDLYQRWGHKRHYIKPEERISLKDETIATCMQWNPNNIDSFINRARELGLKIELK